MPVALRSQPFEPTNDSPAILRFPCVYEPPVEPEEEPFHLVPDTGSAHRTPSPVRSHKAAPKSSPGRKKASKPAQDQRELFDRGVDAEVLAVAEEALRQYRDVVVPETQRAWIAANLSVRQFRDDWLIPEERRRVDAKKIAPNTVSKTNQAINRWERFTRPVDWPATKPWPGFPIGKVTSRYATAFLERLAQSISPAAAKATWSHLRVIFRAAHRLRAIESVPQPEPVVVPETVTLIYSDFEIERVYRALAGHVDLQVAFVLALNAGPRAVDLFGLQVSDLQLDGDRPGFTFAARKTCKLQLIPLAPITVAHLRRLPSVQSGEGPVFPRRQSQGSRDPERSREARARNGLLKQLLTTAGITFTKPFQAARATCNERLERHCKGAGLFVLGHALTLNSTNYRQPDEEVYQAVNTLSQPACFSEF